MIRAIIPSRPSIPSLTNIFMLEPVIKINTIKAHTIIIPVPKSGSNIINPKNKSIIPSIGKTKFFVTFFSLSFFDKYFAVNITSPILLSSLGCIPKGPNPNQLLLPFLTTPFPGI